MRTCCTWAAIFSAMISLQMTGCSHLSNLTRSVSNKVARVVPSKKHDAMQMDIARLHERKGKLQKANELYTELYRKNPAYPGVAHRLGVVSARMGNRSESIRFFEEARTLTPDDSDVLNDLGYALYLDNDLKAAEQAIGHALKSDPNNTRATTNMALIAGRQGEMDESFRLFRRVVGDAKANSNVAYLHAQQGQGAEALERFNRALTLDNSLKTAANGMVQIAQMQDELNIATANGYKSPLDDAKTEPQTQLADSQTPEADSAFRQIPTVSSLTEPPARTQQPPSRTARSLPPPRKALPLPQATPLAAQPLQDEFDVIQTSAAPVRSAERAAFSFEQQPAADKPIADQQDTEVGPFDLAPPQEQIVLQSARLSSLCPDATGDLGLLVQGLDSDDVATLKRTIHRIGRSEKAGAPAVPALKVLLRNDDTYVRVHAALALWRVEANAEETISVALTALRQPERGIRSFAATVLGEIGAQSESARPVLETALADRDGYVRLHVAEALGQHPAWTTKATEVLSSCLNDRDDNIRWLATYSLADLAPQNEAAVSALMIALLDQDLRVRAGAAFALGEIGPAARSAVQALESARTDADEEVRASAEQALKQIDPTTLSLVPTSPDTVR